jgi:hypothetical protein
MNLLAFWYQVIIASEHMLGEAIFLLPETGWEAGLRAFYEKHLADERNHSTWLKDDLGDHPVVLHYGAAQLAGMSYYLLRHVHPVALLGYMQALEGKPIDPALIEHLEREHGSAAVRTLKLHALEDPKHIEELLAFPVPENWKPLVENTRLQTLKLLEGMYA